MKATEQLTQRRRPGRPQWSDLKDRVVDAGLRLLSRGEALTIRGLAREVGKTQQAIYIYYPGMDAVKAAIATRGFRRLAEQLQVSAAATPDARARLGVLIAAYIRFALQNRALFRLMFSGEIPAEFWTRETGEGDLLDARIATMGVVSQVIRQAQDADVVQAGPSLELARMGWALAHGVATLALEDQPYFQGAGGAIERVAEETATVFLRGVGTR